MVKYVGNYYVAKETIVYAYSTAKTKEDALRDLMQYIEEKFDVAEVRKESIVIEQVEGAVSKDEQGNIIKHYDCNFFVLASFINTNI